MKKIYLAGPLFSKAEQDFNRSLRNSLCNDGFEVFLPQEECEGLLGEKIFLKCKGGIDSSDIVLAILDGADADSGTCWECGYAFATGKQIIAVRTDFRESGDTAGFNAMLFYSALQVITGDNYLTEIADFLKQLPR
jgi:nucleoside 2-deoxyribosyltransferase